MLWFKRIIVSVLLLVAAAYTILFTLENTARIDINLFFIQFADVQLDLVVLLSFIVGGLAGLLSAAGLLLAQRKKYRVALFKAQQQR